MVPIHNHHNNNNNNNKHINNNNIFHINDLIIPMEEEMVVVVIEIMDVISEFIQIQIQIKSIERVVDLDHAHVLNLDHHCNHVHDLVLVLEHEILVFNLIVHGLLK